MSIKKRFILFARYEISMKFATLVNTYIKKYPKLWKKYTKWVYGIEKKHQVDGIITQHLNMSKYKSFEMDYIIDITLPIFVYLLDPDLFVSIIGIEPFEPLVPIAELRKYI